LLEFWPAALEFVAVGDCLSQLGWCLYFFGIS
jgi:hypothetical protein